MFIQRTDKFYIDWGKKVGVFEYSEHGVQIIPLAKTLLSISKLHILSECLRSCLYNQPSFIFTWLKASSLDLFIQPIDNVSNSLDSLFTSVRFGFSTVKFFRMVSFSLERFCSKLLWELNIQNSKKFKSFGNGIKHCRLDNFHIWIAFQKNDRNLNYSTNPIWDLINRYAERPRSIFCWLDYE